MPYYRVCKKCGATLDPGEKCRCEEEKKEAQAQAEINKKVQVTMALIQGAQNRRKGCKR